MNCSVSGNQIVKIPSAENSYYAYDCIFKLTCICDLCVKNRLLRSPKIDINNNKAAISFCLQIQLKSPSVFLQICDASAEFNDFNLKLSIRNKQGVKCYNREYSNLSTFVTNSWNAQGQIKNEYTFQYLNTCDIQNCNYIISEELIIAIEIFKPTKTAPITRKLNLQSDMKNLQQNEKLSDVTLVVGNRKFQVHKAILSSRSSVFLAMFENEMKEKIENKIVIEDASVQAMVQMLNYVYTEMVDEENFKDIACDVLPLAHKYDIQGLIDICEVVLAKAVDVNNAFKLLLMADVYKLDLLKKSAIAFVASNAKDFVETDEFQNFIVKTHQHWLKDLVLAFG